MPVSIKGSGGGGVTLDAGAAATDTTLTLPNTDGTVINTAPGTAGNVLTSTGSAWASSTPAASTINVQSFDASGTWTKPTGYAAGSRVLAQCWGGGASGAKTAGTGTTGGGGGGGGAYIELWFTLSALGATETVTIAAGGTAITVANTSGNAGGNTTFGSLLTAYGGGRGLNVADGTFGGGGGGQLSAANTLGQGGSPFGSVASTETLLGEGGTLLGYPNFWGGAGGGGGRSGTNIAGSTGGASYYGGGGGGGAGQGSGAAGAGGTSIGGGAGGASSVSGTAGTGTQPAGGGGGTGSGTSGAGGAGRVIVTVFPA